MYASTEFGVAVVCSWLFSRDRASASPCHGARADPVQLQQLVEVVGQISQRRVARVHQGTRRGATDRHTIEHSAAVLSTGHVVSTRRGLGSHRSMLAHSHLDRETDVTEVKIIQFWG